MNLIIFYFLTNLSNNIIYKIFPKISFQSNPFIKSEQCFLTKLDHYKKIVLLQRAKIATKVQKTAAKGPFDLLWRFYPPLLQCHYRSVAVVTKSIAIDWPFSSVFSLLRQAENHHHMRLSFGSSDLLAAGIKYRYRVY